MKSHSEESSLSCPESLGRHHIIGPHTVIQLGRRVDPESSSAATKVTHGGGRCTLSGVYAAGFYFLHAIRLVEFMTEDPDSTDAEQWVWGKELEWLPLLCSCLSF